MDEVNDGSEVIETPEEVVEEVAEEVTEEEAPEAKIARLEKEKEELAEKNKKLYARTKSAESKVSSVSTKDLLALQSAGITADDIDEVQDFASYKKLSLSEALAHPTLKTILAGKAEERRTAQATQTSSARGTAKTSGADLLRKAETLGEVPETDAGMREMVQARLDRRRTG